MCQQLISALAQPPHRNSMRQASVSAAVGVARFDFAARTGGACTAGSASASRGNRLADVLGAGHYRPVNAPPQQTQQPSRMCTTSKVTSSLQKSTQPLRNPSCTCGGRPPGARVVIKELHGQHAVHVVPLAKHDEGQALVTHVCCQLAHLREQVRQRQRPGGLATWPSSTVTPLA